MGRITRQMREWQGRFGREYTDRNALSLDQMEEMTRRNWGITRTEQNAKFLDPISRSVGILEVGSNIGNQLACLQRAGFERLNGIELQPYAIRLARARTKMINFAQASAFSLPFRDGAFDLVFTAGVLIHISPEDIPAVLDEIHRCTSTYIWGSEYYSDDCRVVPYRGHDDLLWKADYARLYLERFSDLALLKEERLKYVDSDNVDTMFLLRKKG